MIRRKLVGRGHIGVVVIEGYCRIGSVRNSCVVIFSLWMMNLLFNETRSLKWRGGETKTSVCVPISCL